MLNYRTGGRCVLGIATILLAGCLAKPKENTLSHGLPDGGYERISQEIIQASDATSDLTVVGQNSEGSSQNLQWLQTGQADFALTQLDVASEAMKAGRIQAVATLAEEFIYIIVRNDSSVKTLTDLAEQRVAVGTNGSGIHYTSLRLFSSAQIPIVPVPISPKIAFQQLNKGTIDALVYVGPHRSSFLQTELSQGSVLRIVPIDQKLINYLVLRSPESYQAAKIASGIQRINPPVPPRDISTLATATALVTTPDTDSRTVALIMWSLISNARQFSLFYPELAAGNPESLLTRGLVYLHPGTIQALTYGDPRAAWARYIQQNKPLQTAMIMLTITTSVSYFLRRMRQRKSKAVVQGVRNSVMALRAELQTDPRRVSDNLEEIRQQQRLRLIDDEISKEVYDQLEQTIQPLAEQCRTLLHTQRQESIQQTFSMLDDWQLRLRLDPSQALQEMGEMDSSTREMLAQNRIDLQTYLQIKTIVWQSYRDYQLKLSAKNGSQP